MSKVFVEVCIGSLDDAQLVEANGLQNIELNAALPLGGLTPSAGLVDRVRTKTKLKIVAMCRPRPGGFCYNADDWETLRRDAELLRDAGVTGLALGALTEDRQIDRRRIDQIRTRFPDIKLVFHRAFDLIEDQTTALDSLIEAGFDRVLTSGGASTAWEGRETLRSLREKAAGRIEILMGGGITADNCLALIEYTGCSMIHGTFSTLAIDPGYADARLRFAPNDSRRECDRMQLNKLCRVMNAT